MDPTGGSLVDLPVRLLCSASLSLICACNLNVLFNYYTHGFITFHYLIQQRRLRTVILLSCMFRKSALRLLWWLECLDQVLKIDFRLRSVELMLERW